MPAINPSEPFLRANGVQHPDGQSFPIQFGSTIQFLNAADASAFLDYIGLYAGFVTTVAGRAGAVVLTTADIGGLGTIATQSAAAVAITGGTADLTTMTAADGNPTLGAISAGSGGINDRIACNAGNQWAFRARNSGGGDVYFGASTGGAPDAIISNTAGSELARFYDLGGMAIPGAVYSASAGNTMWFDPVLKRIWASNATACQQVLQFSVPPVPGGYTVTMPAITGTLAVNSYYGGAGYYTGNGLVTPSFTAHQTSSSTTLTGFPPAIAALNFDATPAAWTGISLSTYNGGGSNVTAGVIAARCVNYAGFPTGSEMAFAISGASGGTLIQSLTLESTGKVVIGEGGAGIAKVLYAFYNSMSPGDISSMTDYTVGISCSGAVLGSPVVVGLNVNIDKRLVVRAVVAADHYIEISITNVDAASGAIDPGTFDVRLAVFNF